MGCAVTRRLPRDLALLYGVPANRRNDQEPVPQVGPVEPPAWLSGAALDTWRRLAPELIERNCLTAWDTDLFARYCWAEALSARLMAEIDRDGPLVPGVRGNEMVKHKSWAPLRQLIAEMVQLGSRFGLTPSDRRSISAAPAPTAPGGPERLLS